MTETIPSASYIAILPLRDIVVFPHMIVPLFVGRERSVKALESVMQGEKQILLLTQKTPSEDDPGRDGVYMTGTIGTILQLLKLPDGTVKVLVEGVRRARVTGFTERTEFMEATYETIASESTDSDELKALSKTAAEQFEEYVKLNKKIPPEVIVSVNQLSDPSQLADTLSSHLALKIEEKQKLLETISVARRFEGILAHIEDEIGVLHVEKRIRGRVKRQMEKSQREYYLNEQLKAIQKELAETD